jgi:hypothetical protein
MFVIFARRVGEDVARVNYLDRPWTPTSEKVATKGKIVPIAGRRPNFDRHMNIDGECAKDVGVEIESPDKSF